MINLPPLEDAQGRHLMEALEYFFAKSRLSRAKALRHGELMAMLQAAGATKEQQGDLFGSIQTLIGAATPLPESKAALGPPADVVGIDGAGPPRKPLQARKLVVDEGGDDNDSEAEPEDVSEKYWASRGFQRGDKVVVLDTGGSGTIDALYNNAVDVHLSSGGSVVCKEGEFELPGFMKQEAEAQG